MREKSEQSKIRDKRGVITTEGYTAWKTASESKTWGKASKIYDPVVGRTVHTLSSAETKVFWRLRFLPEVKEIYEQFPMDKDEVTAICHFLGMPAYSRRLSTDFIVKLRDEKCIAICVKHNSSVYDALKNPKYEKDIKRLMVEKIYWKENYGIPVRVLYGDEMGDVYVNNIKNVMHFWDPRFVTNRVSLFKHLLARHVIELPMDCDYLRFGDLAEEYDVEALYEAHHKKNI